MQSSDQYRRIRSQTEDNLAVDHVDTELGVDMHDDHNGGENLVIVHNAEDVGGNQASSPSSPSSPTNNAGSYHRGNSLGDQISHTVTAAVASAASAAAGTKDGYQQVSLQQEHRSQAIHRDNPATTKATAATTSTQSNQLHKRGNSWDLEGDDDDDDDLDDHHRHDNGLFEDELEEEDAQAVRRYAVRRFVPAEFSHRPFHQRVWQAFVELRTAARQRRAARLLNDSQYTPTTHCILTWCCDATDRGIALVAVLVLLWLVIGWTHTMFKGYWLLGLILFGVRVSARRTYESFVARKRRSTLPGSLSPSASSSSPSNALEMTTKDYRDHA